MSRVYRIKLRESLHRVVRATDHVSTQLEVLEILPAEAMAQLLAEELARRGFEQRGKQLSRRHGEITIQIDPETATVTVHAQTEEKLALEAEKNAVLDRDLGRDTTERAKNAARQELRESLEKKSARRESELQQQLTEKLEGRLADLRQELNQVVNRVTAEALKRKAAQIGQIKELTEDPEQGALTIVLEV